MPGRGGSGPKLPRAPGWYPDPWSAPGEGQRFFDGKQWGSTEPFGRHATVSPLRGRRRFRLRRRRAPRGSRRFRENAPTTVGIVLVVAVALVIGKLQQGGGGRRATLTSSVANDRP